jgi:hypothetical protein
MAQANTVQRDVYAFGDDDGSESGHTLDTENTNRTAQVGDVTFLIRIGLEENGGKSDDPATALFAQKNGSGGFTEVTTSRTDGLKIANDTQSRSDDESTTERLTAGTGDFISGKYDDGQTQQGTTSITLVSDYTEMEYAIQLDSANATQDDYWELRVEHSDGTDFDSYPGTYPTVTYDSGLTQVNKDLQAKWDITELVNKDMQVKYDMRELVNKDNQSVWDIFNSVYKDTQALWDIRNLVNKDMQAVWDMSGAVNKDMQVVYDILNLVNKDLQSVWDIFNSVYKDVQAKWDILDLVNKDVQLVWDMREVVNKTMQVVWDIREVVYKLFQAKWDILSGGDAPADRDQQGLRSRISNLFVRRI